MRPRWIFLALLSLAGLFLVSCTPGESSLKKALQKKSFCKLSDFELTAEPKDTRWGIDYEFVATVKCSNPKSMYIKKFPTTTPITGKATMQGIWFGLRHELRKYQYFRSKG